MKLSSYAQMKTDGSTVHLRECDSDLGGRRLDRTYESVVEIGRPSGKVVVIEDRTHWELLLSSSHTLGGLLFRVIYWRLIELTLRLFVHVDFVAASFGQGKLCPFGGSVSVP
uniref:Uncharacterized protein n=1 Tax=Ananas comosus var. bracteatus TaxID=296719 RepID=A0A6V7QIG9_ANACO|nr:unnamed protein product [Ananas comosus var. bracteatus]